MPEGMLLGESNWGRQERYEKHKNYGYQPYPHPYHSWKSPECVPEWEDKIAHMLETTFLPDERSQQEILNAKIDNIYDELSKLIAQRSSEHDSMLEERITALSQQLRSLQKQEADMVREYARELLSGPIAEGLEILRNAKQIRAQHGIIAAADAASSGSDVSKT